MASLALPSRRQAVPSSILGSLIFVLTEGMFFAGTMSAYTISRANAAMLWPPPGQPRLPAYESQFNTGVLVTSAVLVVLAQWLFVSRPKLSRWPLLLATLLGAGFLFMQYQTWLSLKAKGLTVSSSAQGSFFALIVGFHTVHTLVTTSALSWATVQAFREKLTASYFNGVQVFWYFTAVLWVAVYGRLYF